MDDREAASLYKLAADQENASFQATGLAGLVADNGGVINAVLITGTDGA
jgi:hypothetical protein